MSKRLFFTVATLGLFLLSCKKEESLEEGTDPDSGGLLKTQVIKLGSDSVVISYAYDSEDRLMSQDIEGAITGAISGGKSTLERNTDGIIQKILQQSDDFGPETITYLVNYDAAQSRYTSKVATYTDGTKDSVAFSYDATGKVSMLENFVDDGTTGGYLQYQKLEYVYGGSGVSTESYFEYDASSATYIKTEEYGYEYDDKVNPLYLPAEAFLLGQIAWSSTNNLTRETHTYLNDPGSDDVFSYTYVYNTDGRPASASVTPQSVGLPLPVTFTYQ